MQKVEATISAGKSENKEGTEGKDEGMCEDKDSEKFLLNATVAVEV